MSNQSCNCLQALSPLQSKLERPNASCNRSCFSDAKTPSCALAKLLCNQNAVSLSFAAPLLPQGSLPPCACNHSTRESQWPFQTRCNRGDSARSRGPKAGTSCSFASRSGCSSSFRALAQEFCSQTANCQCGGRQLPTLHRHYLPSTDFAVRAHSLDRRSPPAPSRLGPSARRFRLCGLVILKY